MPHNKFNIYIATCVADDGTFYYSWKSNFNKTYSGYGGPIPQSYKSPDSTATVYCGLAHVCGWLSSFTELEKIDVVFKLSDADVVNSFLMLQSHPVMNTVTITIINSVISDIRNVSWRIVHKEKNAALPLAMRTAMWRHEIFF